MNQLNITQDAFITSMEVKLNVNYTEEQKELIKRFGDGPTFCFADPGTGKTFTAIGGLLNAELFKGIPGENIYALSFTRLATSEMATRFTRACENLRITKQVNFHTLHALCRMILSENYRLLGMQNFGTAAPLSMEQARRVIEGCLEEWGEEMPVNKIKNVIRAITSLNAALIFDEDSVRSRMAFKECGIDYELFDKLRGNIFAYSLLTERVSVSDMLLYTVMLLQQHPEISENFKKKCRLMLVDEAQDLSLLQLRVINLLTDNPVFIGDMKQQIYAFNGACQEVVQEFHKLFPSALDMRLSKSFRCRNEIADYATEIIKHNHVGGEDYKGIGPGGKVHVRSGLYEDGLDIVNLAEQLHEEFVNNRNRFEREYLFLTRNNISLIPIMEELYKQGLPFRVNKFAPAYEVPVIQEMCEILALCNDPSDYRSVVAMRYLIPEFKAYALTDNPYYIICKKTGCSIFEVNYQFRNADVADEAMHVMMEVHEQLNKGATVGELFNLMWRLYYENYVRPNEWRFEAKPEYYIASVNSLTRKPYNQFIQDEIRKKQVTEESERYQRGVRCYTMHASKGLEADCVYIIDANEGLIPNQSKLNRMISKQCALDAARAIREERSLCYVACTRAKEELYIIYTSENPAPLLMGANPYGMYDAVYESNTVHTDDIRAFTEFTERYIEL